MLWSVILLASGITGWMQLIRDEPERFPQSFHLPDPLPSSPTGDDLENGLLHLHQISSSEIPWREYQRMLPRLRVIVSGIFPWNTERVRLLTKAAPKIRIAVEEALKQPAWHESRKEWGLNADDSNVAQIVLLAQSLSLLEKGQTDEAVTWLELCRAVDLKRVAACDRLENLVNASVTASWVNDAVYTKAGLVSTNDPVLQRVWRLLSTPVISPDQFLAVLAADYRRQRSLFAGEEVDGMRFSAGDFMAICCASTSARVLASMRFKRQATCNLLADQIGFLSQTALHADAEIRRRLADALFRMKTDSTLDFWSWEPNRAGRVFAAKIMASCLESEATIALNEAEARTDALAIAKRRWSLAHGGASPANLADLVPDYLPEIPAGP